ncbi:GrpB family protein [Streptomyces sp. LN549]|uniref:GrpB family protein n=1 Tax=Streptomyces sp. LN549 TaxID=3112979 RepID=UPI0037200D9C
MTADGPVGARSCNVHLREDAGPNARFALLFRDYLRADEATRRAWGRSSSGWHRASRTCWTTGRSRPPLQRS